MSTEKNIKKSVERKITKIAALGTKKKTAKILKFVVAKEPELRSAAAKALANIRQDEAFNALVDLVRDDDLSVRREAIVALGIMGRKAGAEHIRSAMSRPENVKLIAECQSSISEILASEER
ncbi:MAG: HEAT repeat domain-containing protein [Clostridiales bacterium]|nr:HEAT repeat domain-containing protein [Clostridiales bacterium]